MSSVTLVNRVSVSTTTTIQRAKYVHYNRFGRCFKFFLGMANLINHLYVIKIVGLSCPKSIIKM